MIYPNNWLDIANRALIKTGNQRLESLTDTSDNVVLINALLPSAVEAVAALYPWRCLRNRMELAPEDTTPVGYDYRYPLPNNFAELVEVITEDDEEWVREAGAILTDSETCIIVFTQLPENPTYMTPHLRELVALRLAYNIVQTTTSNTTLMNLLSSEFNNAVSLAEREDTQAEADITDWEDWNNYR